jgi:pilus assembly protein CpaD
MRGPVIAHAWIVALAAAVTACSPNPTPPPRFATTVGEDPNPIKVKTTPVDYTVHFLPGVASLSPEATTSLQAFLRDQHARPGETATVKSDDSPLGDARRSRVVAALRQAGLGTESIGASDGGARNTLVVSLMRSTVVLPRCPNWPQLVGNDNNAPSSNLGCATANDLAILVADPNDLVRGREPGPAPAEPAIRAAETYRSGTSPSGGDSASQGSSGGGGGGTTAKPAASTSSSTTSSGGSNAQ